MRKLVALFIALLLIGLMVIVAGCGADGAEDEPEPFTSCAQMFIA